MEAQGQSKTLFPRLSAEFEPQQAILLSIGDWQPHHFPILSEIVLKTQGHAKIVVLYNDQKQLEKLIKVFSRHSSPPTHVSFLQLDLNTIWLRDFGPRLAEMNDGTAMSIDFYYDGTRPKDDELPETWSTLTHAELNHVPWTLQGGNLLANGRGLAVASQRILKDNRVQFSSAYGGNSIQQQQDFVIGQFKLYCNIKDLVLLKPLESESTQHVDMFMTFLQPDLALVAQVDRNRDPRNAQILDWNARRLAQLKVDGSPMRVERIAIPPRQGKYWSPYTNIILTDRLVLVPTFESDPPAYVRQAVEVYRKLLPKHHVTTINMNSMNKLEGSLHCLSCNIPKFAKLPEGIRSYSQVVRWLGTPETQISSNLAAQNPEPRDQNRSTASRTVRSTPNRPAQKAPVPKTTKPLGRQPSHPAESAVEKTPPKRDPSPRSPSVAGDGDDYSQRLKQTRDAVETYRKNYRDAQGDQVDGYVVSVSRDRVELIRANTKEPAFVMLRSLGQDELRWLSTHKDQINRNGSQIKRFLLEFD